MYQPSSSPLERLRSLFQRRVKDGSLAYVGDGNGKTDVPGKAGYVYVRFSEGKNANGTAKLGGLTTARATGVAFPNYDGSPVYVGYRYNNELEIVSAHYGFLDKLGINTSVLNPLNQQSKFVYLWQLTMGLANAVATTTTASTRVMVKSFRHYVADTFNTFDTPLQADKIDLSAYIPAADEHCYAAVWIDTYTNLPVVTTSTAQDMAVPLDETDLQELIVTTAQSRPADGIPLKAFYLANAQTTITANVLDVDLRQVLNNPVPWGFPTDLTTLERVWPGRTLVTGPYTTSGVGALDVEAGAQVIIVHQNNFTAIVEPDADNDSSEGYSVGSLWFDATSGNLYVATDVSVGAATWEAVALGSGTDPNAIHDNVAGEIAAIAAKTTLVGADIFLLEDSEDSDAKKSTTLDDLATAFGLVIGGDYILVQDQKTSGTTGGNFAAGADRTRTLNTLVVNTVASGVSLSSNQLTLPAGTYRMNASAPAYSVDSHQAFLYNITDSVVEIRGTSERATFNHSTSRSFITYRWTITTSKTYEIRHRCQTTNVNGFGLAASFGTELYTSVEIIKE